MCVKQAYEWAKSSKGREHARAYFAAVFEMRNELAILFAKLDTMCTMGASNVHSGIRKKGTSGDPTGGLAVKKADLESLILGLSKELRKRERDCESILSDIPDDNIRQALKLHALVRMEPFYAARKLNVDVRTYFRWAEKGYFHAAMRLYRKDGCTEKEKMI